MNLALAAFDVQLIKGDILHFCKGLIKAPDKNQALENNPFTSHSWETNKTQPITSSFCLLEATSPKEFLTI